MEDGISQRRHSIATDAIKAFPALYEVKLALTAYGAFEALAIAIVKDKLQAFVIGAKLGS